MTLCALTHAPDVWACGIASAAVTNWRLYTSIYTERYLGLPETDGKAYDESSVLASMSDLEAPLLIVQGTDDDNVHAQHTLQVIDALTRSRKPYELLARHRRQARAERAGSPLRHRAHDRLLVAPPGSSRPKSTLIPPPAIPEILRS